MVFVRVREIKRQQLESNQFHWILQTQRDANRPVVGESNRTELLQQSMCVLYFNYTLRFEVCQVGPFGFEPKPRRLRVWYAAVTL